MQPRRSLRLKRALVAGALVLAMPLLGGCGFDKATDRPYTPAAGVNDQDGAVDVLAATVVAAQPGSGTFVAALSNKDTDTDAELESVAGSGATADLTVSSISSPIQVPARGAVNLADEDPITISGDFGAGDFLELTLTFASGDTATMDVPVVFACDAYEGLDSSASASESASPSESPSESGSSQEPYDCETVLEESSSEASSEGTS